MSAIALQRSTILTSNIPWDAWGEYVDDHLGATAIIDRLRHRSHVIVINGPKLQRMGASLRGEANKEK